MDAQSMLEHAGTQQEPQCGHRLSPDGRHRCVRFGNKSNYPESHKCPTRPCNKQRNPLCRFHTVRNILLWRSNEVTVAVWIQLVLLSGWHFESATSALHRVLSVRYCTLLLVAVPFPNGSHRDRQFSKTGEAYVESGFPSFVP